MLKHRFVFILIGVVVIGLASLPYLMTASCVTRPQTPGEQKALDTMRSMTRNDVLPSEDRRREASKTSIRERKPPPSPAFLRARIKLNARDFNGAASLLDTRVIADHSSIADYALFLRADALEQAGKRPRRAQFFSS
jgi:hypothetical protein